MATHAFIDPFRAANYLRGHAIYQWEFISLDDEPASASNGLSVNCTMSIDDYDEQPDFLVVNASWTPENFQQRALQAKLRKMARTGTIMCGLDTGAFVLAQAGLMKGHRAAMHYEHVAAFRELFPYSPVEDDLFVMDGDRLTCCGGMAAADMALEIIHRQQGLELANGAARYIFHDRLRPGHEGQLPQKREPIGYAAPTLVRNAIMEMERHLEQPKTIADIAAGLNSSQRQLERLFRTHTGVSPVRFYIEVRLDRARGLVTQTDLSIAEVAAACGFGTAVHFTRAYKKRFGATPSHDRVEGRVPFQFRSYPSHAGF